MRRVWIAPSKGRRPATCQHKRVVFVFTENLQALLKWRSGIPRAHRLVLKCLLT